MSWRDRDYPDERPYGFGRPGGDWQGIRPTFDNPLTWSVPSGRVAGIQIRVHIFFLVYIVIELLRAATPAQAGAPVPAVDFTLVALSLAILFLIVLVHEFGHCLACRVAGGSADEILMWPLGGLAYCRPRHHWRAHFITAVGGPLVNVALCLVAAPMLGLASGRWLGVALPNPLHPFEAFATNPGGVFGSWVMITLYLVNVLSFILLVFNLLPIFPLDGGRLVQALLWPRFGYASAMRFAVRTGYVGAIGLFVFGAVVQNWMLVGIAVFGGITCYITQKQVAFTEEMLGFEDDVAMSGAYGPSESVSADPTRAERREARRLQKLEDEAREVDRILQKIAESGMESLTRRERRLLRTATHRKRSDV